ncbi:MAG: type IV pilin protein [Myxococcota bacterium]
MITVAIIGVLAAIAVPQFTEMQLKAKRAELPGNVDGIRTSEIIYDATFDTFLELPVMPRDDASLDKKMIPWVVSDPNWDLVGWEPDGEVRGNYMVTLLSPIKFSVVGRSDCDDDDALAEYTASENTTATITEIRSKLY